MLSHSHFNTGVQTHDSHAGASHVPVIRQQCHVDQPNAKRLSRGSTTCTFCSDLLLDLRHASQYHYQSLQTPSRLLRHLHGCTSLCAHHPSSSTFPALPDLLWASSTAFFTSSRGYLAPAQASMHAHQMLAFPWMKSGQSLLAYWTADDSSEDIGALQVKGKTKKRAYGQVEA